MRETAEILLKMPMRDGAIDNISGIESLAAIAKNQGQDVNLTLQDMILVATIRKAMKGDIRAVEFIQSLMGETAEKAQVSPLDTLAESIKQYEDQDDDRDTHIARPREPPQIPAQHRQHGLFERMGGGRQERQDRVRPGGLLPVRHAVA